MRSLICWFVLLSSQLVSRCMVTCIQETSAKVSANVGDNAILPCTKDFTDGVAVPYVVQWQKRDSPIPIYIWYDGYPPHTADEFIGRVSLTGAASLNLTSIIHTDHGWYECKIFFLNRPPETPDNGTWVLLDVQTPPQFKISPPDIVYVKVGESISLPCEANGTPSPAVSWFKDNLPLVDTESLQLLPHELRITNLRQSDMGDYKCSAENREGIVSASTRLIVAGPAVITTPPRNLTRLEGDTSELTCITKALPSNVTYRWFHDANEITFDSRVTMKRDGSLVISPSSADDAGSYTCEVTNGIGSPDTASAVLTIEFPARVTYSPTIQFLPLGRAGIIKCHVESMPPFQFITWTKDRRPFDATSMVDVKMLNNGSLFFEKVTHDHQGSYRCTPYNVHGTGGASSSMDVLVREAPLLSTIKPTGTAWSSHGDFTRSTSTTVSSISDKTSTEVPSYTVNPSAPSNVTVQRVALGYAISWSPPSSLAFGDSIAYYYVEYKESTGDGWKTWEPTKETKHLARGLRAGHTYAIRVVAYTSSGITSATQVYEFDIPSVASRNTRDKAVAAGVVGGILFFVAAIVLSVCAVKICNKRKRRKAEKAYMMVTCPIMDTMSAKQPAQDRIPSVSDGEWGTHRPSSARSRGSGESNLLPPATSYTTVTGGVSSHRSIEIPRRAISLASFNTPPYMHTTRTSVSQYIPSSSSLYLSSSSPFRCGRNLHVTASQREKFDEKIAQIRRERSRALAIAVINTDRVMNVATDTPSISAQASSIQTSSTTFNSTTAIDNSYVLQHLPRGDNVPQSLQQSTFTLDLNEQQLNMSNDFIASLNSSFVTLL